MKYRQFYHQFAYGKEPFGPLRNLLANIRKWIGR